LIHLKALAHRTWAEARSTGLETRRRAKQLHGAGERRGILPFLIRLLIVLGIITYVPIPTLWLPDAVFG
jgi:hypothetical protein